MRLSLRFRYALYAAFTALFATGALWLLADNLKAAEDGERWQSISANALMVHGGLAMTTLLLLGGLGPLHIQRAWRARKNWITGSLMVTINAIFVLTAFALYYSGSDVLRHWMSNTHIVAGFLFPVLIVIHIRLGRLARRPQLPGPE